MMPEKLLNIKPHVLPTLMPLCVSWLGNHVEEMNEHIEKLD
jgi:hypothetical protein